MGGGTFSQDLFGVHADVLIPGRGDPIPHGGMIVSKADGIIVWVGAYPSLPSKYNNIAFTKYSGALMPGMCTSSPITLRTTAQILQVLKGPLT